MRIPLLAALLCACVTFPASAQTVRFDNGANDGRQIQAAAIGGGAQSRSHQLSQGRRAGAGYRRHDARSQVAVGRPAQCRGIAWCGCWLADQYRIADKSFNRAVRWASWGSPAKGPAVGVVAVWRHHVGVVTGVPGPGRIVLKSGNDGHAVRERERSTRGIIAYRWPPGSRWAGV